MLPLYLSPPYPEKKKHDQEDTDHLAEVQGKGTPRKGRKKEISDSEADTREILLDTDMEVDERSRGKGEDRDERLPDPIPRSTSSASRISRYSPEFIAKRKAAKRQRRKDAKAAGLRARLSTKAKKTANTKAKCSAEEHLETKEGAAETD